MGETWTPLTNDERRYIYQEHKRGRSDEDLAKELGKHRSTIYRARRNMPDSPLDEPFQWHKLDQYGLPWEASGYLLTLWHGIWSGELETFYPIEEAKRITARNVLWWWRVHLAAPDISPMHTLMWASRFVNNEIYYLANNIEPDFEGFYQALAYRSSEGEEQAEIHNRAVEEGRIKPVAVILTLPPREKERGER
jgi:hypothetical protein